MSQPARKPESIDEEIGRLLREKFRREDISAGKLSARYPTRIKQKFECHGKEQFSDFNRAYRVARLQSRRHGQRFVAYRCPHCGCIHTGASK